jgi:hypothetical protein
LGYEWIKLMGYRRTPQPISFRSRALHRHPAGDFLRHSCVACIGFAGIVWKRVIMTSHKRIELLALSNEAVAAIPLFTLRNYPFHAWCRQLSLGGSNASATSSQVE